MSKFFISHSSQDDGFVRELQRALGDLKQDVWIDSRELRGGDPLWPVIQKAIEEASAYAVVVSKDALQSEWVGKELRHALDVQKRRGRDKFPVIPLSLNGTKLGVLKEYFVEEPVYIPVSSDAGGIDAALNPILVALGKRLPTDVPVAAQPKAEPLEELVLEFTDLKFHEQDGVRHAVARARLVYEPAKAGQREVASAQNWRFVAPIGPIEAEELRWYLEKYSIWPSEYFRDRARKVGDSLVRWGQLLHRAALPVDHTSNVLQAWSRIDENARRRFSIYVDAALEAGAPGEAVVAAREAATFLLGLPWELLHDGNSFLFQGAKPTRVRRRLPNTRALDVPVVATPIRILLVTPRPEDDACRYIDHRSSELPLVETMETLGGLVQIHVLNPPTLPALREELDRGRRSHEPYHVVHFDGHGVYDRRVGLGGLCFEDPQDIGRPDKRRHKTVFTSELGPMLQDHRIPLVFLEACQTAQAERASESVASELLKVGVASVVAMSHSVLVETARRFVESFYAALARGARAGDAMLEGQRRLKDDTFRGRIFGVGELRLEDWFVPVLFQEKDDPQLFRMTPTRQTQKDVKAALAARFGKLPAPPETGFIGRSRELLALQRLLHDERYAVVRGQAGEGKTALAVEYARWMVRSHQIRRAVFVSVETHSNVAAVLDAIGAQLVPNYSVATFEDLEKAILPVERALAEQSTQLVLDNMESISVPPYVETPEALSEDAGRELDEILKLCARLNAKGDTRIVFTSREALPSPFHLTQRRLELYELHRDDAVKLVERALNREAVRVGAAADAARDSIEQLVDTVHSHARTLALLAPALRSRGVEATHALLVELMFEMEQKFPGSREKSLFASVELSLRRISATNRERSRVLGVFYGGVDAAVLCKMMGWENADVISLSRELIQTGLATPNPYNHLTLNPALCPYLSRLMDTADREALRIRCGEAMRGFVFYLDQQRHRNSELSATLTLLELPNLFALLEQMQSSGNREATLDVTTWLFSLLQNAGKPRLLERVAQVRDAVAAVGEGWNHAQFNGRRTRIEENHDGGHLAEALDGAQKLLQLARAAGEQAYPLADYDLAGACFMLARVLETTGAAEQALPLLDEAKARFEAAERNRPGYGAARMASACITERANSLRRLGRLNEAGACYEEGIRRSEQEGAERDVAVGKSNLARVHMLQHRYKEALQAYQESLDRYMRLNEPRSIAGVSLAIGQLYKEVGKPEEAEDAYRRSLAIDVQLGNVAGQAGTLLNLGNLYLDIVGGAEQAAAFYSQARDKYVAIGNVANEGLARSNLSSALCKLGRLNDARQEVRHAIKCKARFGHTVEPWVSWKILADIESDAGNPTDASEANSMAIACYLAYRRNGGENHYTDGRICLSITPLLLAHNPTAATLLLEQYAADNPNLPTDARSFIQSLQAIVAGSRGRTLADAPELHYTTAAEILLLIETLEKGR